MILERKRILIIKQNVLQLFLKGLCASNFKENRINCFKERKLFKIANPIFYVLKYFIDVVLIRVLLELSNSLALLPYHLKLRIDILQYLSFMNRKLFPPFLKFPFQISLVQFNNIIQFFQMIVHLLFHNVLALLNVLWEVVHRILYNVLTL